MKNTIIIIVWILSFGCNKSVTNYKEICTVENVPDDMPIKFMEHLCPSDKIIHKGIFNPKLDEYYYTLSDLEFRRFDVYVIKKINDKWSKPEKAFFNSDYSDHGMSFSPDGQSVYFSSTRPTNIDSIPSTWHIWKANKVKGKWGVPVYVDIPNLRDKLISHPSITSSGVLYFHSSNLDYSDMSIYYSKRIEDEFESAKEVSILAEKRDSPSCTPYISPNEDYMLFAFVEDYLELMIAYRDENGIWTEPRKLNVGINTNGQGNPFITPDERFLFYTSGKNGSKDWSVKWVEVKSELSNNKLNIKS